MLRDLAAVCVVLLCVTVLQVYAPCPFAGDNPALPKQAGSAHSAKVASKDHDGMSEKLMVARLKSMINVTDKDQNGKATFDELTAWTQQAYTVILKEEAEERRKEMDTDKDGKVSLEEFLKSQQKLGGGNTEYQKRRFNLADEDHDGMLTQLDEIISIFHPEESPHMFDVVADEYLQMGDSDKDGFLSFDEYKIKVMKKSQENDKVAKPFFDRQDKDQDGKISAEEIKMWLKSMNSASMAIRDAQNLLDKADDDKDGGLSEEEILNHVNLFTGKSSQQKKTADQAKSKDEL